MDRSKQLSEIVRRSMAVLTTVCTSPWCVKTKELDRVLRQIVKLLFAHQDYTDCSQLDLADDFVWLPNEVIYGIVESEACGEALYEDYANLTVIDGPWAVYAHKFATSDRRSRYSGIQEDCKYKFAPYAMDRDANFCDLSMDRSWQLSEVVGECLDLHESLSNHDEEGFTCNKIMDLFRQSVQFMCVDQDYTDHLRLNLANDFANLPNTIIVDIVSFIEDASVATNLALIQGSWAKYAAGYFHFSQTDVNDINDLAELKEKAPQLYGFIRIQAISNERCEILGLMGTRFSHVLWHEEPDCRRSESARIQVTKFLKRQLESQLLRHLLMYGATRTEDLNELLVEFVKRPQFEYLLNETVDALPFEVIEEAHKAWESAKRFAVNRKSIFGIISEETLKKIDEKFSKNFVGRTIFENRNFLEWKSKHPTHNRAEMVLGVFENHSSSKIEIEMEFRKLHN